ncbi:hypothetical protein BCR41DRAFT_361334 [Lobosporangium transversale]|uniref:Zn(2)-C6 fungal-type domain-containing protein n=1 Tax=Lobosporangium transversale TaxID=64571 RepID=A0A1Y2GBL7_9FUNG|nr:hypothetical protein BCR41DRAFT_361334 [Lobosporangium transversale]ORZ06166.1 hypothetical protein BCR41DRAFT_361334 [Lobosporangium transversale]|eukprot:XP_021877435.1 hypothetical protein BCR41DRAFT_361334 [Lobosporangium transversale]
MNNSSQQQLPQQQDYQQQQHQPSLVKQEPQESIQLATPQSYQQQPFQYPHQAQPSHNHGQSYTGLQGSSNGNINSFSALPSNPYNISSHLMGLSMQNNASSTSASGLNSSSLASVSSNTGLISGTNSGSTTPALAYVSAPSSPILGNLQYNPSYNQNNSSLYHQHPHQQHQQHSNQYSYHNQQQHQPMTSSNLSSSFYPASPPHQHQQQQQQTSSTPFTGMPSTPLRQQQSQYAPLVPPMPDAQYAQYHQILGSALSSAASTPYHSNHSTPYSSMPTSPTLEYQQLADPNAVQKPKRRQVKNACVNCQKACKKCDEGRPCMRCIKYGLQETCVDSTRKVRKKGIKRGPYKRKVPPSQLGSASASATPTLSHAVLNGGPTGYMSEPVTALNSPTQSHMLPFTTSSSTMGIGYGANSGSSNGYPFQTQGIDNSYVPSYTTSYSGASLYSTPYGMNDGGNVGSSSSTNNTNNSNNHYSNLA